MSEVITSFKSLRDGLQVFALLIESDVAMHLVLWYVVLVCNHYDVCKIMLAVCMLVGMDVSLSESVSVSSVNCVQSFF